MSKVDEPMTLAAWLAPTTDTIYDQWWAAQRAKAYLVARMSIYPGCLLTGLRSTPLSTLMLVAGR